MKPNSTQVILILLLSITFSCCKGLGSTETNATSTKRIVPKLSNSIWAIYQDSKDNYWFGSNGNGLYCYDGKQLTLITTEEGLIDNTIRGIQEDHLGNIFIETPSGVSKYNGKSFTTLKPIIAQDNEWKLKPTDLWFNCNGNASDVYRFDGKKLYRLQLPLQNVQNILGLDALTLSYSPYTVFGIDKDKQGNIWFGTVLAGAFRYDGKSFLWVGEKELSRLPDGREPGVRSMLEDKDGNMWLSNFISKYKIKPENSIPYEKSPAVDVSKELLDGIAYFNSGLIAKNGDLWMTTYGGDVWKYDGKELFNFPITNGKKEVLLISIYEDNVGTLWLGTNNDGVYKQNDETFEKFEP